MRFSRPLSMQARRSISPAQAALALGVVLGALWSLPSLADDKFSVHGYLTQAYADSSEAQVLGIPTDGTTDYRTMALQFRYAISDRSSMVVQLSHELLGESPFEELSDDVELDWAFYEHRFPSTTSLRIGRVPIPFGIYNELRDVGTILEFYRPPSGIYFEGGFSNESVDGIVLSHRFEGSWTLAADLYYGGWTRNDATTPQVDGQVAEGVVEDAIGAQLWLEPPIEGLRFGLAAQSWTLTEGLEDLRSAGGDDAEVYLASADFDRDRWYVRGEYQWLDTSLSFASSLEYEAWYLQAGVRLGAWSLNVLREDSSIDAEGLFPFVIDPWLDDFALSVNYSFSPSTVAKVEYHDLETSLIENPQAGDPFPAETEVFIASLSVSF